MGGDTCVASGVGSVKDSFRAENYNLSSETFNYTGDFSCDFIRGGTSLLASNIEV